MSEMACCSFFNLVVNPQDQSLPSVVILVCGSPFESEGRSRSKTWHMTTIIIVSLGYPPVLSRATLGSLTPAGTVSRVLLFCHMPGKHRKPINRLSKAFLCLWHMLNLKKRRMMDEKSIERGWGGIGRNEVFILTHCDVLNRLQCSC